MVAQELCKAWRECVLVEIGTAYEEVVHWRAGVAGGGGHDRDATGQCDRGEVEAYVMKDEIRSGGEEVLDWEFEAVAGILDGGSRSTAQNIERTYYVESLAGGEEDAEV